jgi:hypothetical protein
VNAGPAHIDRERICVSFGWLADTLRSLATRAGASGYRDIGET